MEAPSDAMASAAFHRSSAAEAIDAALLQRCCLLEEPAIEVIKQLVGNAHV